MGAKILETTEAVHDSAPSQELAIREHPSANLSAYSRGKYSQLFRDSLKLLQAAGQMETMSELFRCAAVYNNKEHKLYLADTSGKCKTFEDFVEMTGLSPRSIQRLQRIAEKMKKIVIDSGNAPDGGPFIFTQKALFDTFKPIVGERSLTLRGLYDSSKEVDTFRKYLDGSEEVTDRQATKLLKSPTRNVDREEDEALLAEQVQGESNAAVAALAAQHGFVWDREQKTYTHEDGSALTDEELSMLTTTTQGLKVWSSALERVTTTKVELYHTLKREGPAYLGTSKRLSKAEREQANERFSHACKQLDQMRAMLVAVHTGDIDELEEIHKNAPIDFE